MTSAQLHYCTDLGFYFVNGDRWSQFFSSESEAQWAWIMGGLKWRVVG